MGYFDEKKEIEYADYIDEVIGALHRGDAICNNCNAIMTLNKNFEYVCPKCHKKHQTTYINMEESGRQYGKP